jgi:methylmalonyl-CoA/ethylmalonyl-CoA epimerase
LIKAIGQIAVNARDVARATAFYRDVLELPLLFEVGGMAFFDCGGVRLMLSKPERAELDHPGSILYYRVEDINVASERLKQKGVVMEQEPHFLAAMSDHDLWMAFLRDSEGNLLALMSEVRK